jgi:hypothetical protein
MGDLLVVKHPNDDLSHITDVEEKDRALVDSIVRKYTSEDNLPA